MAVYTSVSAEQVKDFLGQYDLGAYVSHEGIVKGVTNSNFHLFTTKGHFILTLFEKRRVSYQELPFFFGFATYLSAKGIACPQAQTDRRGRTVRELAGRAAVILDFLEGSDVGKDELTAGHCAQAGDFAARMHVAAQDFPLRRDNSMGIARWQKLVAKAGDYADEFEPGLYDDLCAELAYLKESWPQGLESGAVHADMFPDNVFFKDGTLTAVIDFYFSCTDFFAFDLAVIVNAWCFEDERAFSRERFAAMMQAYQAVRPLPEGERAALQVLARGAAFRTLISRLEEYYEHDAGSTLMQPHDPGAYLLRLRFHQENNVADFI